MKNIRDILDKRPKREDRGIDEKSVESVFFSVVKKEFPSVGRADIQKFSLKDKKISLRTGHPAIASEIWRNREILKEKINCLLESESIEEIKVK